MEINGIGGIEWPKTQKSKEDREDRQNVPGSFVSLLGGSAAIDPITGKTEEPKEADPVQEFRDYMSKSPEQRMQESWLQSHGITAEEFAAMSPVEKQKILEQMRTEIENKMKDQITATAGRRTDILV